MKIEGHYDADADIAWLRFEGFEPTTVVGEEVEHGLREVDPDTGQVVGLEYWRASNDLPGELLAMLPPPPVAATA